MPGFIDSLVGIGVIVVFFYLMWKMISHKHPQLGEAMSAFAPSNIFGQKRENIPKEEKKQIWKEDRSMI